MPGQEYRHEESTVAVGQLDALAKVVLGIPELLELSHHVGSGLSSVEIHFLGEIFVERQRPLALEVEGVEQVADGHRVELVLLQQLLYHALSVVVGPLVDDAARPSVAKVAALGCGIVVVGCRLHEVGQQVEAAGRVHIDVVRDEHLRLLVERVRGVEHLAAEAIDGLCGAGCAAQYLVDLLLRLARGAVVEHAQGVGDAQRREHQALVGAGLAEEAQGEVVVVLYQLTLLGGERNLWGLPGGPLRKYGCRSHQHRDKQTNAFPFHILLC